MFSCLRHIYIFVKKQKSMRLCATVFSSFPSSLNLMQNNCCHFFCLHQGIVPHNQIPPWVLLTELMTTLWRLHLGPFLQRNPRAPVPPRSWSSQCRGRCVTGSWNSGPSGPPTPVCHKSSTLRRQTRRWTPSWRVCVSGREAAANTHSGKEENWQDKDVKSSTMIHHQRPAAS